MTGSRRTRSKKEGTFLEGVKTLLEELKGEIASIKAHLSEVSTSSRHVDSDFFGWWHFGHDQAFGDWDSSDAWAALGLERKTSIGDTQGATCHALRASAPEFTPIVQQEQQRVLSRNTILSYRSMVDGTAVPKGFSLLSVVTHDVCLLDTVDMDNVANDQKETRIGELSSIVNAGKALSDFRSCPQEFWDSLYDRFEGPFSSGDDSDGDSDLEYSSLRIVWLSLDEFASKFLPLMDIACVQQNYGQNGLKDFDEGVWYRPYEAPSEARTSITRASGTGHVADESASSPAEACQGEGSKNHWCQKEIETWIRVTFRHLQNLGSSKLREECVLSRWQVAAPHLPDDIRDDIFHMLSDALDTQKKALKD